MPWNLPAKGVGLSSANPNSDFNYTCTEEQLAELLIWELDFLYNKAISKLLSLGNCFEINLALVG